MTAQNISWSRLASTRLIAPVLLSLASVLFAGFIFSGSASAETNLVIGSSAPTLNSGTSGGADFTPLTGVGHGDFNGEYMWYKIYVKNGQGTTITVNQTCTDSTGAPTVDYTVESLSNTEQDDLGIFTNSYGPVNRKSSVCSEQVAFQILPNAGTSSGLPGHTQYQVFAFIAQIEGGPGSAEQYFTVSSSNTANTFVGMSRPDAIEKKALKFSTLYKTSGTWSASVIYAPRCNITGTQAANVQVYDADNGVYQGAPAAGPYMTASLEKSPGSPAGVSWSGAGSWDGATVQGPPGFGVSNTTGTLPASYDGTHIYKLHFLNSAHPNTIQVKLPFDQFDATPVAQAGCSTTPICTDPLAINYGGSPPCQYGGPNPVCTDRTAINFGGPLPCQYGGPLPSGSCNNTTAYTPPGQAVNFSIIIHNTGGTTLDPGTTRLYITGPQVAGLPNLSGSFALTSAIPPNGVGIANVSLIGTANRPIPTIPGTYPNFRTYQLGTSQTNLFGPACALTLVIGVPPPLCTDPNANNYGSPLPCTYPVLTPFGDLVDATCTEIVGHVYYNDSDVGTATAGRLHIAAYTNPAVDLYTNPFTPDLSTPHSAGGHWFAINPYDYNPAGVAPQNNALLNYHDKYYIQLQVQDSVGGWHDAPGAAATMQYPCITGSFSSASCTNLSGTVNYQSTNPAGINSVGEIHSSGLGGSFSTGQIQQHFTFSKDPFNSGQMGGQNLPQSGVDFHLYYWDTIDGTGPYPALNADGSPASGASIDTCLDWGGCSPNQVTFEAGTTTQQGFAMGYTNYTLDNIPGFSANLTSNGTVRVNGGTGPIGSGGGISSNGSPPYPGSLVWNSVAVSSTGAPYNGSITMVANYRGTVLGGANCQLPVYQVTKPYFKAFGASVSTGGAFAPSSNPTSEICTAPPAQLAGGVRGFAHFNPATTDNPNSYVANRGKFGASVEYSIESLGLIHGDNAGQYGFYSGDTHDAAGDLINTLDVGDQTPPSNGWGGKLGGSHCVEDYYDAQHTGTETNWSSSQKVSDMFNSAATHMDSNGVVIRAQAFQTSPGAGQAITLDGGTPLPSNTRATLFVNGDVYISKNITYSTTPFNPASPSNPDGSNPTTPPYFALIATGNIYVDPSVTQLDGLYVAQGTTNGFATCGTISGTTATIVPKASLWPTCKQKLVVNGAVVAYKIRMLRIGDETNTLNKATGDTGSSSRGKTNGAVEEFNYTPNMLENFPYYLGSTTSSIGSTEKLFSLPPVY